MNKKATEENVLSKLHHELVDLPVLFRNRVCEECNYSTPTFYRKLRGKDKLVDGRLVPILSNAEKQKIREIGENVKEHLVNAMSTM